MPVLNKRIRVHEADEHFGQRSRPTFLSVCANPKCASSWLQVWRSRTTPVLERRWSCSSGCTRALLSQLIRREGEQRNPAPARYRHRIPIGLVLLEKGWISHEQLKNALDEQRAGYSGRIGAWLMEHCGLEESRLTQALSAQWNCPVFSLDALPALPATSPVPRLFMESFRFFPIRPANTGILHLAFEDQIDHSVTLAIERMTGLRVEAGLVHGSEFEREHHARMRSRFLPAPIIESMSMDALLQTLTSRIEKEKPLDTQIVRLHDFYWLRLWKETMRPADPPFVPTDGVLDLICSLTKFRTSTAVSPALAR